MVQVLWLYGTYPPIHHPVTDHQNRPEKTRCMSAIHSKPVILKLINAQPIHFQNIMCQTWHVGYRYHNHNRIIGNWWVISYQQSISAIPLLSIWIDNNTQHSSDHVHRCWASLSPFSAAVPWLPPPSFACWAPPSASAPDEQKDGGTQGKTKHASVEREIIEMFLKLCESFWPKAKTRTCGWLVRDYESRSQTSSSTSGTCCWCAWLCWWLKAFSCFSSAFKLANLSSIE